LEKFVFLFDCFTLDPQRRTLLKGDEAVPLGSRALDLLIALVERSGEVLSRDYLVAQVWPNTYVEDSSLRVHIAALRRALSEGGPGTRFIVNAPGRGYSFVAATSRRAVATVSNNVRAATPARLAPAEMLGREQALVVIKHMVDQHRVVSVVGFGGVGKTLLAQHLLHRVSHQLGGHGFSVDLSGAESGSVRQRVTAALGVAEGQALNLAPQAGLLLLDSCERVLDEVAGLVDDLRYQAPRLKLICTSREPLDVPDEHVFRLEPLELASATVSTLAEAMQSGAVALFVMRARANGDAVFHDADAAGLATLCAQLDGLPLAIGMAAARFSALGLAGLLARRDERLDLLTRGRRTADARHRSLRAAIEWSYDLLTDAERSVFAMLSVFQGSFSLSMAAAVVPSETPVAQAVLRLVDRSLVAACGLELPEADATGFRMPETFRGFARERLNELPEAPAVYERHVGETLRRLTLHDCPLERPAAAVSSLVDDLVCALDWLDHSAEAAPERSLRLLHAGLWALPACGRTEEFQSHLASALATLRTRAAHLAAEEGARLEYDFEAAMNRSAARTASRAAATVQLMG
jgi:predicted ATPase/DNA-binding winged helix-turn-helix (wHTH) protein